MQPPAPDESLLLHLTRVSPLDRRQAQRVLEEIQAFFAESVEEYVQRRHAELRAQGKPNAQIFEQIFDEAQTRPFRQPRLSARQVRRLIYG